MPPFQEKRDEPSFPQGGGWCQRAEGPLSQGTGMTCWSLTFSCQPWRNVSPHLLLVLQLWVSTSAQQQTGSTSSLFLCFRQSLTIEPWLAENSLYRAGWPGTQRSSYLWLLGLKVCTTKHGRRAHSIKLPIASLWALR